MFLDPKRLTCPVCNTNNVYGIDQLHYEADLFVCTGYDEEELISQEVEGDIPF